MSTYAYASGGRLIGVTTNGVTESRTTDNGGRETSLAVMSRQLALTYDSDDHVTRVVDGANTTAFAFDSAGRRTSVIAAGTTKRFLTAPNLGDGYESPQAITDASGAEIASFVYAGEQPLAKLTATGPEYYLADAMGTVIGTADGVGEVVNTLDYDAFGNERGLTVGVSGETHGDFRLHGMWQDPSGLYYVRARVYDAGTGRVTSRDPANGWVERSETFGPYVFAASCPHVWADPDGRFIVELMISLSARLHITAITVASYAATHLARMGALRAASFAAPALLKGIQILGTKDQAVFRRFAEIAATNGARGLQLVSALAQAVTEVIGKTGKIHYLGQFAGQPVWGSATTRFGIAATEVGTFLVRATADGIVTVVGRI